MNFKNAGVMRNGLIYTEDVTPKEIKYMALSKIIQKDGVDEKYYLGNNLEKWNYLKGSKDIIRKAGTPHEYHFREGAIAFPDSLDKPARTMLTSEGTKNRSTHVIADPGNGRLRILTPVETERIQGFDDEWTKISLMEGKETEMPARMRRFCMGNALVVPMITRMGKVLDEIIDNE
mgnify:CR=1 FL=1